MADSRPRTPVGRSPGRRCTHPRLGLRSRAAGPRLARHAIHEHAQPRRWPTAFSRSTVVRSAVRPRSSVPARVTGPRRRRPAFRSGFGTGRPGYRSRRSSRSTSRAARSTRMAASTIAGAVALAAFVRRAAVTGFVSRVSVTGFPSAAVTGFGPPRFIRWRQRGLHTFGLGPRFGVGIGPPQPGHVILGSAIAPPSSVRPGRARPRPP